MTYYDITGKLELTTASNQKEITERLFVSLHSVEIAPEIGVNNELTFKAPVLKTLMRGNDFQGISSGLTKNEINRLVVWPSPRGIESSAYPLAIFYLAK